MSSRIGRASIKQWKENYFQRVQLRSDLWFPQGWATFEFLHQTHHGDSQTWWKSLWFGISSFPDGSRSRQTRPHIFASSDFWSPRSPSDCLGAGTTLALAVPDGINRSRSHRGAAARGRPGASAGRPLRLASGFSGKARRQTRKDSPISALCFTLKNVSLHVSLSIFHRN